MNTDEEDCWFRLTHDQWAFPLSFNEVLMLCSANQASAAPANCAAMKGAAETGEIPAKESVNILPIVTAGLAKEVDEVKK